MNQRFALVYCGALWGGAAAMLKFDYFSLNLGASGVIFEVAGAFIVSYLFQRELTSHPGLETAVA